MHPDRTFERFASVPLLRALPPDRLELVLRHATLVRLPRSAAAFRIGDDAEWIGIVEAGLVRGATWSVDGRRAVLWLAGLGETFGERALFEDVRTDQAEAAEAARVWRVPALLLRDELGRDAAAARCAAELFSHRSRDGDAALEDAVTRDVGQRVARRLCDIGERLGTPAGDGEVRLAATITHDDLADMVGASRESVTRTIGQFRALGWVVASRGRRWSIDLPALRAKAGVP